MNRSAQPETGRALADEAAEPTCSVEAATTVHPQVAAVEQMAQQFRLAFRERNPEVFKSWLARGMESEIPEVKSFVAGIQRDYEAVLAAVEQPWSNGQVEGQVHRLKLIKRQLYGRGGFLLLRRRMLPFRPQYSQHSPSHPPKVRKTLSGDHVWRFWVITEAGD